MRTPIKSLLILLTCIAAGTSLYGSESDIYVPERLGAGEWLGKGIGSVLDFVTAGISSWVTDPRYDGMTKVQRLATVGCFGSAVWLLGSDLWKRKKIHKVTAAKAAALCTLGLIASARPWPRYVPNSF